MGNTPHLEDARLKKIMTSFAFGVITSDDGAVKKSNLFRGLAQIKSKHSESYREMNTQSRKDFALSMIQEFGMKEGDVNHAYLTRIYEGEKKQEPLSIRDAQTIIRRFAKDRDERSHMNFKEYNSEQITLIAKRTLADNGFFAENITPVSVSTLKNQLLSIHEKGGSGAMREMVKAVETWLKMSDIQPTKGLAEKLIADWGV